MSNLVTPDEFRAALGRFASGVTVITVDTAEGDVHGMTANAFCSVSLRPPLVLVCVDHLAETYLHLRERGQFGVSVLKEEQEALSEFFADPERNPDAAYRLGIEYRKMSSGTPCWKTRWPIWTAGGRRHMRPATTPSLSARCGRWPWARARHCCIFAGDTEWIETLP